MSDMDYTVQLEQLFKGPLDLLLHLVREEEVDIHEIEIGKILKGYMAYLKALESIDIEVAGDFLVMAATLMAIKSRSLLPQGEEVDLEAELDPRDELIQRLIEYRHFKTAAGGLNDRLEERSQIFERGYRQKLVEEEEEPTMDLSEVNQWDLLATFSRLMRETLADRSLKIEGDSRPLRFYVGQLLGTLKVAKDEAVSLRQIVEEAVDKGESSKPYLVGTFCALLELVRVGAARVFQENHRMDVQVRLREDIEGDLDQVVAGMGFEDERAPEEMGEQPDEPGEPDKAGENGPATENSDSDEAPQSSLAPESNGSTDSQQSAKLPTDPESDLGEPAQLIPEAS